MTQYPAQLRTKLSSASARPVPPQPQDMSRARSQGCEDLLQQSTAYWCEQWPVYQVKGVTHDAGYSLQG